MTVQKIRDFVTSQVAELADKPAAEVTDDEVLVGDGAVLDSRNLVVLMIAIEEFLEEQFGVAFEWYSDSALSGRRSRLRTVGTFVELVAEKAAGTNVG
jgi:acyl carrier protein